MVVKKTSYLHMGKCASVLCVILSVFPGFLYLTPEGEKGEEDFDIVSLTFDYYATVE